MKGFALAFWSEFYKSRKTLGFWAAVLLPLIITSLVFVGFYFKHDGMENMPGMLLWVRFTAPILGIMGTLLLPIFIIFIGYSVNAIEHRADTWKTLFTLPIPKWPVYAAKYFYALFLVFMSMMLFAVFGIVLGNLLGTVLPQLKFHDYNIMGALFQIYLKLFLSALGILSIQFLLSLLWADFLKPMGIGFVGTIVGDIVAGAGWKYAYTIPYAHPMLALQTMLPRTRGHAPAELKIAIMTNDVYISLGVAAVVFIIGFFVVQKKSVK